MFLGCDQTPRDGWEENYCPVCVCELPPEEPSACDDITLDFNGTLTAKFGGSEACSALLPNWSVKAGMTVQQMCQVPVTQFVDILDGAWTPPAVVSSPMMPSIEPATSRPSATCRSARRGSGSARSP